MNHVTLKAATLLVAAGLSAGAQAAGYSTGFEASEGFTQGSIVGQNGWTSTIGAGTYEVRDGLSSGNGSPNALRLTQVAFPNNAGLLRSPVIAGQNRLTIDVRIDDNQGADYNVLGTRDPSSNQTFRVQFSYTGTIFYQVGTGLIDTGVAWSPNVYKKLDVLVTAADIQYRYDGALIATQTTFNAGGNLFDQIKFTHSNDQDLGFGSFSGGGNPAAAYFDNLTIVPAPGTGASLVIVGILAARRRRN